MLVEGDLVCHELLSMAENQVTGISVLHRVLFSQRTE